MYYNYVYNYNYNYTEIIPNSESGEYILSNEFNCHYLKRIINYSLSDLYLHTQSSPGKRNGKFSIIIRIVSLVRMASLCSQNHDW